MRKQFYILVLVLPIILLIGITTTNSPQYIDVEEIKTSENSKPLTSYSTISRWQNNGTLISNATNSQNGTRICSDGNGGAIITWYDYRDFGISNRDIYAQWIDLNGGLQWTENGTVICNDTSDQIDPEITSDGDGGAIITWIDNRGGDEDIYAQKINDTGTLWTNNGTVICNATDDQNSPQIISDGDGGAIITWVDKRLNPTRGADIYVQRIDRNENNMWAPNGTAICNATNDQTSPQIISDGDGGAIITWVDNRNGNEDIYSQLINSTGHIQWINNGTIICNATDDQNSPQICTDENGGAFITWVDKRLSLTRGDDIYSQLINSTGHIQWINNGTVISNATNDQTSPQLVSDGDGGAIITWVDNRSGNEDIYTQRINSAGYTLWIDNGTVICLRINDQNSPQICTDRRGGAFISWVDNRSGNEAIYIQAVDSSGETHFALNGLLICISPFERESVQIISDGDKGAIITWVDNRSGSDYDIYSQRIVYRITIHSFFYDSSSFGKDFQESISEYSEALVAISITLIIVLSIFGIIALILIIRKVKPEESRKWG